MECGERNSMFRCKAEIVRAKQEKKIWANTWFLSGDIVGTISCPATPGGKLRKEIEKSVNTDRSNSEGKFLVVEDGGRPIHVGMRVNDPRRPSGCVFGDRDCIVDSKYQCDKMSMIYRISCISCNQMIAESDSEKEPPNYIGLTRTSIHATMMSHLDGQKRMRANNPLYRHDISCHNGITQKYVCIPVASERKIVRLNCNEALHIEKQDRAQSMNDRMECGRGGLVRITATRVIN